MSLSDEIWVLRYENWVLSKPNMAYMFSLCLPSWVSVKKLKENAGKLCYCLFIYLFFVCVCYLFSHVKLIFVFFLVLKKWIFFFLGLFVWRYHWIRRKKKLLFTLLRGWVSACNWFIYFLISTACSWFISVMFLNFHIFFSSFYSYLFLRYLYSY